MHTSRSSTLTLALLLALSASRETAAAGHGLDLSGRDTTCSPCQDFFQYASGSWVTRTTIPASYPGYGSFQILRDRNQEALHRLLEDAARKTASRSDANLAKLGAFYGSCMESARAEVEGMKPLEPTLAAIAAIRSLDDLTLEAARLQAEGVDVLFRFGALPDLKNSTMMIAVASQGGLGLPDRDYYTREDSTSRAIRDRYVEHVARILELIGEPRADARARADKVMEIETSLARASMTNVQRRDPKAVYHMLKVDELRGLMPSFGWTSYLQQAGLEGLADLNVAQPDFFKALNEHLSGVTLEDWKTYLRWHAAEQAAPFLSSPFVDETFRFQKVLNGIEELPPRWKRCVQATDDWLGEALGREYVKLHFSPRARARALEMVKNLEAALKSRLESLDWMGDSTRAEALGKLAAFGEKIGYPDHWRDYSALRIERGSFLENVSRANEFETARQHRKVGKPVDRGEWRMTPPTVNAYYNSSNNDINFPAGILQPPFFDPEADDAVNYGGIGAVIGHEMTHGFDDRGRQFDGAGNLRDWWTAEDAQRYQGRASRVVDQFNGYVAVDTLHLNGKLTLGENIADLGGVAVAFHALERALAGKPRPLIDGLTPEQRFFFSYAQVWRAKFRPEAIRLRVATDPHSQARWRVDGPLSNLPEFAKTFGCKAGDPMVRPDSLRARIW